MPKKSHVSLIVVGNLPPPIHGQSLATERMIALLRANGHHVDVHDIGPGERGGGLTRLRRHLAAAKAILRSEASVLYLPVNNGGAMGLGILLGLCARLSGKAILLHHHSLRYVLKFSMIMRLLVAICGNSALHLVQSASIGANLERAYGALHYLGYSNIGIVDDDRKTRGNVAPSPQPNQAPLRFGYLANITREKGVLVALASFERLRCSFPNAQLIVAGPCTDSHIIQHIETTRLRYGSDFEWIGPIYGNEKDSFFSAIDIFIFPTLYLTETQGMVNLEALGAGVPVVAFDRGCIGEDIGETGGLAVRTSDDFGDRLVEFAEGFRRGEAGKLARSRYEALLKNHTIERDRLLRWIDNR